MEYTHIMLQCIITLTVSGVSIQHDYAGLFLFVRQVEYGAAS